MINPLQKNTLDIGAGDCIRSLEGYNAYGTDMSPSINNPNIFHVDHNLETMERYIPDNSIDHVFAYDFLEHIPTQIYHRNTTIFPRIVLFNDIWRVLKPHGIFESFTPIFTGDKVGWVQDPTHTAPPWCRQSYDYFLDLPHYERLQILYGIKCRFKIVEMTDTGDIHGHLLVKLQK